MCRPRTSSKSVEGCGRRTLPCARCLPLPGLTPQLTLETSWVSSSGVSRTQEEKCVQESLQRNGYHARFVQRHSLPKPSQDEERTAQASVTIPYIHGLSQSIHRVLTPLDINVTFRHFQTLRQKLVHPKDPVPEWKRKGVVYSIPCNECPRTYIGQTGRSLDHRIGEHRRALKNGDVTALAVAEHVFISGHQMDLSKARVVDAHPHTQTCCLLGSWHIQHGQAPLNRGRGTMPGLYATYSAGLTPHSLHDIIYLYLYIFPLICVEHYYHVLSVSIIVFPALLYSRFTFISRDLSPFVCHTVFIH